LLCFGVRWVWCFLRGCVPEVRKTKVSLTTMSGTGGVFEVRIIAASKVICQNSISSSSSRSASDRLRNLQPEYPGPRGPVGTWQILCPRQISPTEQQVNGTYSINHQLVSISKIPHQDPPTEVSFTTPHAKSDSPINNFEPSSI